MKFNPKLKADVAKYINYTIIVEGKKDVLSLNNLGFQKVYAIHESGKSIKERVEEISKKIEKREKLCILTDFDKKGKKLYFMLKSLFQEFGVKTDSTLRGLLLLSGMSHIEGLSSFMKKATYETKIKERWEVR